MRREPSNITGHKVLERSRRRGKAGRRRTLQVLSAKPFTRMPATTIWCSRAWPILSQPTEYGTLYSKKELSDISAVCREYKLPLFLDGARLGYGLMSPETDVTLEDIAKYTSVFYIGGTKVGALCGEAVVFPRERRSISLP